MTRSGFFGSITSAVGAFFAPPTPKTSTMPSEAQIAAPKLGAPSVKMLLPDGTSRYVVLGSGLTLDLSTTPATISAVPLNPIAALRHERLVRNVDGTWQLTSSPVGAIILARNGVIMLNGLDYTINGQKVAFTPGQGDPENDEVITAAY